MRADLDSRLPASTSGRHDTFFALGGHSLKAVAIISGVGAACGVELSMRMLLDARTAAELAGVVESWHGATEKTAEAPGAGASNEETGEI